MPNWRTVDETDLAATLSQSEVDAYRADGPLDGSDRVARILERTVASVRGWISCNGAVRMGPAPGTIPQSLVSPAMDYAAYDLLKAINIVPNEARTRARERAEALFEKIATGAMMCESYTEDGTVDEDKRPATSPMADDGARPVLGGPLWSLLAAALLAVCTADADAKTIPWRIAGNDPTVARFTAYRGETVEFALSFAGAAGDAHVRGADIYYTTNFTGRVAPGDWLRTDGLVFTPANDTGAANYRFYVRAADAQGVNYSANGVLRILDSPGGWPEAEQTPEAAVVGVAKDYDDRATNALARAVAADLAVATNALAASCASTFMPASDAYTKAETDAKIVELAPPPDFSTNNAALVATIEAVAPSGGSAAPEAVRLWTVRDEGGAFTLRRESAAALDGATNLCAAYREGGRYVLRRVAAFDPAALEILAGYDRDRRRFMFYVIK